MSDLAGRMVKTVDNGLSVFSRPDVNSESRQLDAGSDLQLGAVSELDGREWVELILPDASPGFALGASIRSHTDLPIERYVPPPIPPSTWQEPPLPYRWGIFVGVVAGISA